MRVDKNPSCQTPYRRAIPQQPRSNHVQVRGYLLHRNGSSMQTLASRAAIARLPIRSTASVAPPRGRSALVVRAHKVTIKHEGKETVLEVGEDETLLEACVNEGIEVPHDCDMGVCMTCPSRVTSGTVDHGSSVLSDDVMEAGYCLMCVATPTSDCVIETIEEEELLDLQLCA